ncbi:MAG: DUF1080 domain-containing protein [Verrucomicrobia bacterium]|nr:DUF1080 domain-containing protein [Verrucomicrobiota bacterium]
MKSWRRAWRWVNLVAALNLGISARAASEADGWISLFDGETLDGWRASENPGGFKVVDGAIAFEGARSHLFYAGPVQNADFKNFELQVEVLTRPAANSGIYFHTAYQEKGFPGRGFEVQVCNTHRGAGGYVEMKKTGSLYGIRNLYKALVKDEEWFTMHIAVRNQHVQVRLNGQLVVDYVEPDNPPSGPNRPRRRLGRGTFALQGHDPESKVFFRNLRVKPLPDELPFHSVAPASFDAVDAQLVRLGGANFPLVDFHTHLKGGLTLEGVRQHTLRTGINHGIAVNCGVGFAITNDAGALAFLESMAGQPFFVGMQAEGREWPTLFSPAVIARFVYVFTDSMTIVDHRGQRTRLWIKEEVEIPDPQAFMEHLVETIVTLLAEEPVDIYANPTFLPEVLAGQYDALWKPERMRRVIEAAKRNEVAIELNSRLRLPGRAFVQMAKEAGLKFTLGSNNTDSDLGRAEYALELINACKLGYQDFWMPKPDGQKPIQKRVNR